MPVIFETDNLVVKAHDMPHHSRENGGHIVVTPKEKFVHRYELPLDLAKELMFTTMVLGEAVTQVLRERGTDVVRINYQDNGNWAYKKPNPQPQLHVHLYIRTSHEKHPADHPRFAAFPDALYFPDPDTGYYDSFQPLTIEECSAIRGRAQQLLGSPKYADVSIQIYAGEQ